MSRHWARPAVPSCSGQRRSAGKQARIAGCSRVPGGGRGGCSWLIDPKGGITFSTLPASLLGLYSPGGSLRLERGGPVHGGGRPPAAPPPGQVVLMTVSQLLQGATERGKDKKRNGHCKEMTRRGTGGSSAWRVSQVGGGHPGGQPQCPPLKWAVS